MNAKKPRIPCLHCGGEPKTSVAKYCSQQCQLDYQWKLRKQYMEESGKFIASSQGTAAKRYLLERYGHCCDICKGTEWMGRMMPLVLDHVDGNYENWLIENCRMICANCDFQTPTFKNKNKGNGRHARRMRYKAGLSY